MKRVWKKRASAVSSAFAAGDGLKERLREALDGEPDVVVEATGVPALLNSALELVRERGRVVLLGAPRGLTEIDAYKHLFGRGVQVTGGRESLQGRYGLPSRLELTQQSLALIARGGTRNRTAFDAGYAPPRAPSKPTKC